MASMGDYRCGPPPASDIGRLMDDLVAFANLDVIDPVTHAAIVHAQFETIHPFADGNGRVGRLLIGRLLCDRLNVNAAIVGELLGVSEQTARVAISELANLGVLTEFTSQTMTSTRPGRPRQWWVASELLALLGR